MEATGLGSLFWGGARAAQVLYFILKVLYFLGQNRPEFSISEFSIEQKKVYVETGQFRSCISTLQTQTIVYPQFKFEHIEQCAWHCSRRNAFEWNDRNEPFNETTALFTVECFWSIKCKLAKVQVVVQIKKPSFYKVIASDSHIFVDALIKLKKDISDTGNHILKGGSNHNLC